MKNILFLCFVVCLFAPIDVLGQIEMNDVGSVGIGIAPISVHEVTIQTNTKYIGLKVVSDTHGNSRFGSQSFGDGVDAGTGTASNVYGLWAMGENGTHKNFGLYADAFGGSNNYAIYGKNSSSTGTVYAGYFSGNVHITGTLSPPSDERLKEDIQALDRRSIISKIMQLRPVSYNYRRGEYGEMNLREGKQYGLLAQEVEAIFPEFVSEHVHPGSIDEDGSRRGDDITYKGVSYLDLIPLLITAIQEQQAEIDALKAALSNSNR